MYDSRYFTLDVLKFATVLFLLTAVRLPAVAQDTLTLDRAISLAQENNLALRIAENGLDAVPLASRELATTGLPRVTFIGNAGYAPSFAKFGYDPSLTNEGVIGAQMVVEQSLYDGGVRRLKAGQLGLDSARIVRERLLANKDMILMVKQAFVETLRAREEIRLRQESLRQLSDYLALVERLYAGSSVGYTEVLKTRVGLANAKLVLSTAVEEEDTARYALASLIGSSLDTISVLQGDLDSLSGGTDLPALDLSALPDVAVAELGVQHGLLDVDLARSGSRPTVSLIGDVGALTSMQNLALPATDRSSFIGASVALNVSVPMFDWGATAMRAEQSRIAVDTLRLQAELLRRSLQREYRQLVARITSARERLAVIRSIGADAESNFLLSKSKYAGGSGTALEVLDAQQLLVDNRSTEIGTLAGLCELYARMERLISK